MHGTSNLKKINKLVDKLITFLKKVDKHNANSLRAQQTYQCLMVYSNTKYIILILFILQGN